MLAKGSPTVKADGMMVAIKGSEFSMSNGDNAGVAGGVKSSTFMKASTWILYSFDVKMDGQNACRLSDKMFHNHANTLNATGEIQKGIGVQPIRSGDPEVRLAFAAWPGGCVAWIAETGWAAARLHRGSGPGPPAAGRFEQQSQVVLRPVPDLEIIE